MINPEFNSEFLYKRLIIDQIRDETRDFKTFIFRDGHHLIYESGQFITLVDHTSLKEIRRSYSIISSPDLNEPLAISVKRIPNGFFSRQLFDRLKVGDSVFTTGVAGFFRLPENIRKYTGIFFFAAGSGIAPVYSLLKTVLHRYPEIYVYLVYSNPSAHDTAFYEELKQLQLRYPNQLHIDYLFSSASDLRRARLNRELLMEFLVTNRFDRKNTLFYTCGPESYMRMIIFLLLEEGFPKENIRKEDFNPGNIKYSPKLPPDKNTRQIKLEMGVNHFDFPVAYPDSILQAARKLSIHIPFSCETGKCGSCAAICVSGNVWLSNNEVLTDQDLASGLTLTCTGHPQKGDVVLKIV